MFIFAFCQQELFDARINKLTNIKEGCILEQGQKNIISLIALIEIKIQQNDILKLKALN